MLAQVRAAAPEPQDVRLAVALDQLRTVDRERLRKRLGVMSTANRTTVFAALSEMFEFS